MQCNKIRNIIIIQPLNIKPCKEKKTKNNHMKALYSGQGETGLRKQRAPRGRNDIELIHVPACGGGGGAHSGGCVPAFAFGPSCRRNPINEQ